MRQRLAPIGAAGGATDAVWLKLGVRGPIIDVYNFSSCKHSNRLFRAADASTCQIPARTAGGSTADSSCRSRRPASTRTRSFDRGHPIPTSGMVGRQRAAAKLCDGHCADAGWIHLGGDAGRTRTSRRRRDDGLRQVQRQHPEEYGQLAVRVADRRSLDRLLGRRRHALRRYRLREPGSARRDQ